ncbi:MAG: sigma 54-interacting transcriptional regulator [Pseudomonadota bacterium]
MKKQGFASWMFQHAPLMAVTTDREGRVINASAALAQRLDYRVEELIGRRVETLLKPESRRRVLTELRPQLHRSGTLKDVHVTLERRGGRGVPVAVASVTRRWPDGRFRQVFSVFAEIGDQAALHERFLRLYRASPTMLHTFDDNWRIVEVSNQWLSRLGYQRREVIGKPLHDFYTEDTVRDLNEGRLKLLVELDEYTNVPRQMKHRDGRVIEVLSSAAIDRDDSGAPIQVLVASKDMTERNESRRRLEKALEENARLRTQLEQERDYLREEAHVAMNFGQIVGSSPALSRLLHGIEAVARTPAAVLITGESGTGKELVAHAIHRRSDRAEHPLVKVNCASVPKELFESEFFGHVKGAFTGAHRDRTGRFQLADQGTLFLDELGEIPLELQAKLLRVLQDGELQRVGEDTTQKVDVRILAATNNDLKQAVQQGRFREDLYYRLSVFPLEVPPLRDRLEDIPQLTSHFLQQIATDFGREPLAVKNADMQRLMSYPWPGNVRELRNVLERAVIVSRGRQLELNLPDATATPVRTEAPRPEEAPRYRTEAEMRELERANLVAALKAASWRVSGPAGAAKLLGIKPTTLNSRLRAMNVDVPALRRGRPAVAESADAGPGGEGAESP